LGLDSSALLEKLSSRDAEVESLKQRMSEAVLKEQQLLQQLSVTQLAADESQSTVRARDAEIHSLKSQSTTKEDTNLEHQYVATAALETHISQLQATMASREQELESLRLKLSSLQDTASSVLLLRSELKFAEESNLRMQQKNEESLELLSNQSSQMHMLQIRLKAAEENVHSIENRSSEYVALSKERDALSKKSIVSIKRTS
jgi:chromosome segregation ATPase